RPIVAANRLIFLHSLDSSIYSFVAGSAACLFPCLVNGQRGCIWLQKLLLFLRLSVKHGFETQMAQWSACKKEVEKFPPVLKLSQLKAHHYNYSLPASLR